MILVRFACVLVLACVFLVVQPVHAKTKALLTIGSVKEFKSANKKNTNLLHFFYWDNDTEFEEVAEEVHGVLKKGAITKINCDDENLKALCRTLDVDMSFNADRSFVAKHFGQWSAKGSVFTKDYDRPLTKSSMLRFLKNPESEMGWDEDETAQDVVHCTDKNFDETLANTKKSLVMFYAPWCGHCKTFKPLMAAVATRLKSENDPDWTFIGIDVNSKPGLKTGKKFEVKGYPKLMYFENGEAKHDYGGDRTEEGLYSWTKNPVAPPPPPPPEPEWAEMESAAHIAFPSQSNFMEFVKGKKSLWLMVMAPWCGHCKRLKPFYEEAARLLAEEHNMGGILAAIDATKAQALAKSLEVRGFPTFVYFENGKMKFKMPNRAGLDDPLEWVKIAKDPWAYQPPKEEL